MRYIALIHPTRFGLKVVSNYQRPTITGGTYFITQVTYQRIPWLCGDLGRIGLREAIAKVREKYPFEINAFVLLPDHFQVVLKRKGRTRR